MPIFGKLAEYTGFASPVFKADTFGKPIADGTRNELDIASHYPYSPERWRIFVDGSRVFPEYNSVSQYNHNVDVHELSPAAGETVVLETAERPRYVVQYENVASWALSINQALNSGDIVRWGLFDGTDGWFFEKNGSHAAKEVDLVILRNGSEKKRVTRKMARDPDTTFARYGMFVNWYNVGDQTYQQFYTENNKSKAKNVGTTSVDDGTRGPQTGNLPLRYEVTAAAGTSGLTLNAGSVALITLGRVVGITRNKVQSHTISIGSTGTWVPIMAIRTDPNRDIVNVQFSEFQIMEYSASDDVKLVAKAQDPSLVQDTNGNPLTDSNYAAPTLHDPQNSVIEISTDLTQAADASGTVTTSAADPGGFQLGYASLYTSGQSTNAQKLAPVRDQKRPMYGRDTVVIWAFSNTTGDVTFELTTQQDW